MCHKIREYRINSIGTDTSAARLLNMSLLLFEIFFSDLRKELLYYYRFLIFLCNNKNKSHSFRKNMNGLEAIFFETFAQLF